MEQARPTIVVSASEGVSDPVARWLRPVLDAWPAGSPTPRLVASSLALLMEDRARTVAGEGDAPLVLAVLDTSASPACIASLAALARRTRRPMMVLAEDPGQSMAPLVAEGVAVSPWSIGTEALGESLRTLWARQPMVRRLARMFDAHRLGEAPAAPAGEAASGVAVAVQRAFLTGLHGAVMGMDVATSPPPGSGVCPWISSVVQLDTNLIRFYLAETDGCDAETALIMLLVARTLDHQSAGLSPMTVFEPGRSLARLNATLSGRTSRSVAAVYGILDTEACEVTIAGAGVGAPTIYAGPAGRRIELGVTPLGTGHHRDFTEHVAPMHPGDVLAAPGRALAARADLVGHGVGVALSTASLQEGAQTIASALPGQAPPLLLLCQHGPDRAHHRADLAA